MKNKHDCGGTVVVPNRPETQTANECGLLRKDIMVTRNFDTNDKSLYHVRKITIYAPTTFSEFSKNPDRIEHFLDAQLQVDY